ncbi:hypothetical protein [Bradyrhizobium sp. SZCCHNR1098]|uniref:hypothetical protein n=1 Tax=Bradyrhizobium sp. SZCCHNR1098 TaxID=3057370 RepID=UPI002916A392|nr:hypothetical protein [Bradyrhizobium sp. SZCCHNR1098]
MGFKNRSTFCPTHQDRTTSNMPNQSKKSNREIPINISRVRRAIDFSRDFTSAQKKVAGVIADHFNPDEGYAFPPERYLMSVYGFSSSLIYETNRVIRKSGLMNIDRSSGNNRYTPNMVKVESVLDALGAERARWKAGNVRRNTSRVEDASLSKDGTNASLSEECASLSEASASQGEGGAPLRQRPNVQGNAQPNAKHKRPTSPPPPPQGGTVTDVTAPAELEDPENLSMSNRLSKKEQFNYLSRLFYQDRVDRTATSHDWKAFSEAFGRVSFVLMFMNIHEAGPVHSFADCVSGRVFVPHDDFAGAPCTTGNCTCEEDHPQCERFCQPARGQQDGTDDRAEDQPESEISDPELADDVWV